MKKQKSLIVLITAGILGTSFPTAASSLPMDPSVMKPWINSSVIGMVNGHLG